MVQIASRFSVKSFSCQNLLQKAFFEHQNGLKNINDVIPDTNRYTVDSLLSDTSIRRTPP